MEEQQVTELNFFASSLLQSTCFFNGQKKNAPKRANQKDLPVDREIDETPGVWLDTKNIRAARPDCRLYGHKIECLPMDNQLIETF